MARIRTIKPELWTSADFCDLSAVGKLTFIYLIAHSDDCGRQKLTPHHIARAISSNSAGPRRVNQQLDLMEARGMIQRYSDGAGEYVWLTNWDRHQRVDHPAESHYPEPGQQSFLGSVREESRPSRARADRIGKDRKGSITPPTPPRGDTGLEKLGTILQRMQQRPT